MARFDEVIQTFWGSRTGSHPPLTDDLVVEAERLLGVRLPPVLLELLRVQNGGVVADAWSSFPSGGPALWGSGYVPFETLNGIGAAEGTLSLLDTPYLVEEWGLPSPLVLLTGDGHWWIGLDYRECGPRGEPPVIWFDTEPDREQFLASSFKAFVETLTSGPADDDSSR